MDSLSGTDALSVMNATRGNYYGFDGMNGWFWIVLLLFCGRGNFGGYGNESPLVSDEFIKRDIFNTNQNVSTTSCQTQRDVLEGKYDTQLSIANLASQTQNCCCNTQKEILQSRYDNALGMQNLQAQLADCCCSIKSEMANNTQKILDTINNNTIQDLRDRLAKSQRETDTANLALQNNAQTQTLLAQINKVPQPAYITCSPYTTAYNYGCNC